MALVGDVEGEEGGLVGGKVLGEPRLQIGEEHVVVGHILPFGDELLVVVVGEEVVIQAQVGVHRQAVVEPVPAGWEPLAVYPWLLRYQATELVS